MVAMSVLFILCAGSPQLIRQQVDNMKFEGWYGQYQASM